MGHKKEDIIAGLCRAVVANFLNNVGKGKRISAPIVFQGGVSKNIGVKKAFEEATGFPVTVNENGHLTGALGANHCEIICIYCGDALLDAWGNKCDKGALMR